MNMMKITGQITRLQKIGKGCILLVEPSEHIFWLGRTEDYNGQKLKEGDRVKVYLNKLNNRIIAVKD